MTTFTLPEYLEVKGARGADAIAETANWSDEFVAYLARYAIGVICQRASAGEKDERTKKKIEAERLDSLLRGEMPATGGGGGPRLSALDIAERDVLAGLLRKYCSMKKGEAEKTARNRSEALKLIAEAVKQPAAKVGEAVDAKAMQLAALADISL